ncbi:pilus assembly PilX N-terminal domain-containing protein [Desulforhopalus vacuolatus]|uniref:pilus assembly PilX family protein n=1 Tax=Desulforhopalus vacuolatus TaxID=40414 RepID=UPI0019652E50|nr:pilus assembly PilX N-terminal domain-containing protein [Desulforhopalus vacuolatus]MBM9521187.1 pilus assembly PilX N-terminal domain-containing protein [Desulforhopalus vacuolatus]
MSNSTFRDNEQGFVLVITMMILVTLTLIGITAIRGSRIGVQIAGNEKWSQQSFYQADGTSEVATEIVEVSGTVDISSKKAYTDNIVITGENIDMNTDDIDFDDMPALGDSIPSPSLVMPKSAVIEKKLATIPASIVQMTSSLHTSIGVDLNAVPGADATPGSSQSTIQIQTRNYGTRGSVTDIEVYWLHVD